MSSASLGSAVEKLVSPAEPGVVDRDASQLPIAGLTNLSTCDWPGRLVTTVFVQGCPWRCGYCHNPDLIDSRTPGSIRWQAVRAHLEQRRGLLDGVVFSGGEPTRAAQLPAAMAEVRERGFLVGLHTSGAYPHRLQDVLSMAHWVGLDIKGLPEQYPRITGRQNAARRAFDSLDRLLNSGVDCEVRITVDPRYHSVEAVTDLLARLRQRGTPNVVLQAARMGTPASSATSEALLDQVAVCTEVLRR